MVEDQNFNKQDFTENRLPINDYEYCTFTSCNFSNAFLNSVRFLECEFIDCNISSANILGSSFQDVTFQDCKMLGLHLESCDAFGFSVQFNNSNLNHSSFYQMDLKNTEFLGVHLGNVDFSEADLSGVIFNDCDLKHAVFSRSILELTDFRTAINYSLNPENNRMKGAKFSLEGVSGLLNHHKIIIE
ncbi:pentapeptide repeat-containing protein [Tamlana haliotis]|uniref:Pentapeptide repeat-containing protein n=1 Tax=Pseudotamlana haliotis TaxID=2614804 RepID=A0A6N6MEL2_9FLAO|nr:pentapeptide repeat-containing protein [Tamlana haliotis]KAB1067371.1 pentapeptide repeat-containing protein [Tamlana haliotis]